MILRNLCLIESLRCKQSHSEWQEMKCTILEKLTQSELFTMVVIGTRHLKSSMHLKDTWQTLLHKAVMDALPDARMLFCNNCDVKSWSKTHFLNTHSWETHTGQNIVPKDTLFFRFATVLPWSTLHMKTQKTRVSSLVIWIENEMATPFVYLFPV